MRLRGWGRRRTWGKVYREGGQDRARSDFQSQSIDLMER